MANNMTAVNGKLTAAPYVSGFTPSKDDAALFKDMFGDNQAVIQWAARMASYYQNEREAIVNPPKKAEAKPAAAAADDDDDIDLFGEETEEEKAAMEAKKKADADAKAAAAKKKPVGKSSIVLDVKAWDDTCDLEALAAKIKAVEKEGLSWGAHKLTPVAFGVKKLTMMITIIDDLVPGDDIEDIIMQFEDDVQSMDIVAWNKL